MAGCSPTPKDISYGVDKCHFCKMTIVDNRHAAELVTTKGKVYMFDAIECMANYTKQDDEPAYSFLLVNDYLQPSTLIPAKESYYLQSKAIPSPMGAYLSAFETEEQATTIQTTKGGEIYRWEELGDVLKGQTFSVSGE